MSVLDRIGSGELHLLALDKKYKIIIDQSKDSVELDELFLLAKLGQAAEMEPLQSFIEQISFCDGVYNSKKCKAFLVHNGCIWQDFCKLRKSTP